MKAFVWLPSETGPTIHSTATLQKQKQKQFCSVTGVEQRHVSHSGSTQISAACWRTTMNGLLSQFFLNENEIEIYSFNFISTSPYISSCKSLVKPFGVYLLPFCCRPWIAVSLLSPSNYPEQWDFYLVYNWSGVQISNIGGWGASPAKASNEEAFRREKGISAGVLCFHLTVMLLRKHKAVTRVYFY